MYFSYLMRIAGVRVDSMLRKSPVLWETQWGFIKGKTPGEICHASH